MVQIDPKITGNVDLTFFHEIGITMRTDTFPYTSSRPISILSTIQLELSSLD